jgi:hypothetical protein
VAARGGRAAPAGGSRLGLRPAASPRARRARHRRGRRGPHHLHHGPPRRRQGAGAPQPAALAPGVRGLPDQLQGRPAHGLRALRHRAPGRRRQGRAAGPGSLLSVAGERFWTDGVT